MARRLRPSLVPLLYVYPSIQYALTDSITKSPCIVLIENWYGKLGLLFAVFDDLEDEGFYDAVPVPHDVFARRLVVLEVRLLAL